MTNFAFLDTPDWQAIYGAARQAEAYVRSDPRAAVFYGRRAVEVLVDWLYTYDGALRRPYDDALSSLLVDTDFKRLVPPHVLDKLHALRKAGNAAVHSSRPVPPDLAQGMIRELFHITYWFARTYTQGDPNAITAEFDESRLPRPAADVVRLNRRKLAKLQAQLEDQDVALRRERETNAQLQARLAALQGQVSATRVVNEAIPDAHNYSEAETRRLLIDFSLREAGWDPQGPDVIEYPVSPFPNKSNLGKVDYVLWGDDGRPLAVVEAKKTSVDKERGRQQARLYADALETMHGRRPVIFYTNGYEIALWDDTRYPPREVQGFYTHDELQWLIQQRDAARDLSALPINRAIVDRAYQEAAIRRAAEQYGEAHRRALLVMATGTGKTRVAIALVDLLMRAGWVRRVLFLADRTALVKQAERAFKAHLPAAQPVNLLENKTDAAEARVVLSTYHTMMNLIDSEMDNGRRVYGPGHFDLVIIDEAHRSIYQKFGAIFAYFDSLLLGLTATPRDDVDHDTYDLFSLEKGVPTSHYELDEAVADGYLVPPRPIVGETRFLREGIHYDDLSDEEKDRWERIDWDDTGDIPVAVEAAAINAWLFNSDTVDHVLQSLMAHGLKVAGGDRLGKTIIFARNHRHAEFIAERFNRHYPHLRGTFAQVIDNTVNYAQTLIDAFSDPAKDPHIAISVDMLDTGIDVPEVINLVFFKPVRSKTKFWQMIGRGTRLSPDLFGPGQDKEHYLLFDFGGNLEFFRFNPDGAPEGRAIKPLSQRLFEARLDLLVELQKQNDPNLQPLRAEVTDALFAYVAAMNVDNFLVRPHREAVDRFRNRDRWAYLSAQEVGILRRDVAGLPSQLAQGEESAKRFDLMVLTLQLAQLRGQMQAAEALRNRIVDSAASLPPVPKVEARRPLIDRVLTDEFWQEATLPELEDVRRSLREVIDLIERTHRQAIETDFEDTLMAIREGESLPEIAGGVNRAQYRRKVLQFVREADHPVIGKIRRAEPLTAADLKALEDFFYDAEPVGSQAEFVQIFGQQVNLAAFVRSLVGLDRAAAKRRLAAFLDGGVYSADQITFVNLIVDYLTQNGALGLDMLYQQPFTDVHYAGLDGVFTDEQAGALIGVIEAINASVTV